MARCVGRDELKGKRVVVIGGSSGIGFAVARRALDAGAEVLIGSSNEARVGSAVSRLPYRTLPMSKFSIGLMVRGIRTLRSRRSICS